jgi:hypothetical protein
MHSCKETKERITELLLDEADSTPDTTLSAELLKCADCRNEFATLKATLRMTKRSRQQSAPTEAYWNTYHATLRYKLVHANLTDESHRPSLVARFFNFSIPVPAPVAALILVFALLVPTVMRAGRQPTAPPPPQVVHVPVEKPVVQEKVVTRVVYRERRLPARISKRVVDDASKVEGTFAKSQKPQTEIPTSFAGFKPTEEVKLTVIKGGSPK